MKKQARVTLQTLQLYKARSEAVATHWWKLDERRQIHTRVNKLWKLNNSLSMWGFFYCFWQLGIAYLLSRRADWQTLQIARLINHLKLFLIPKLVFIFLIFLLKSVIDHINITAGITVPNWKKLSHIVPFFFSFFVYLIGLSPGVASLQSAA